MSLGSANSLCAALHSRLRSPDHEQAQLEKLAKKLSALTPYVQTDAKHFSIYLEISTCLKLHKGFSGFQQQLAQQLGALSAHTQQAVGPSAECAAVFARHYPGDTNFWRQPKKFWQKWYSLPVSSLLITPNAQQALTDCGFTDIADIVQLDSSAPQTRTQAPRLKASHLAALKRRFGANFADYWQQLCGQQLTLRHALPPPTHFDKTLTLPCEAEQLQAILPAVQSLLNILEQFLIQHCASVLFFVIQFTDTRHRVINVKVQLTQPHHRAAFFFELAQLQLQQQFTQASTQYSAQQRLSAPIIETRLYTTHCIVQQNTPLDLFNTNNCSEATDTLLSKLQARLGQQAICRISAYEDYRPERAFNINNDQSSKHKTPRTHSAKKNRRAPKNQKHQVRSQIAGISKTPPDGTQQPTWLIDPIPITNAYTHIAQTSRAHTAQAMPARVLTVCLPSTAQPPISQQFSRVSTSTQPSSEQTQPHGQFGLNSNDTLTLLQGPHYMLTGWWDDGPAHRGYYIARTTKHCLYWIFQDLTTQQWFLQGFFS